MKIKRAITGRVLLVRDGEPAKPASGVIAIRNPVGRVLPLHRTLQETRIWVQAAKRIRSSGASVS